MPQLTTCLLYHNAHRSVLCCLCGRRWDEQWVSVLLLDDEQGIGPLCPGCLSRCPQETAARLREYGTSLQTIVSAFSGAAQSRETGESGAVDDVAARIEALERESDRVRAVTKQLLQTSDELRQRTAALRVELVQAQASSRRLIDASRQLRGCAIAAGETASLEWVDEIESAALEAEALLELAERFPHAAAWPTTVHEAIYAERRCFRARLLELSPQLLRRAVDDRYMRFIRECA
jgi:hypothetical protein